MDWATTGMWCMLVSLSALPTTSHPNSALPTTSHPNSALPTTSHPNSNLLETPKQMSVGREGNVTDAGFVTVRTVLGVDGAPLTTRSGKLLISECSCQTLRSLGSIATSECKGESLDSLRNRLLFTPAAPPPFWRTLMKNLGAPTAASACGQVAEAALTTALTDRPYLNNSSIRRRGGFRSLPPWHRNDEGAGPVGSLGADEYYAKYSEQEEGGEMDEDSGLAEVDFRQQYDDFA